MKRIKIMVVVLFALFTAVGLLTPNALIETVGASSSGPPPGFTGAPDENNCTACHLGPSNNGQFAILDAPSSYNPGQTYQLRISHINADTTRKRWGFQMTALAGPNAAGTFANLSSNTQTVTDSGRSYIQHTSAGTFAGQTGGAEWTLNWTAPASNVGAVSLYAAGNQANQGTGPDGDQLYTANVTISAPRPTAFDLDGDRKTDLSIFRPGPGEWWYLRSSNGTNGATQFGSTTDTITPTDFTGDGKTDIAFFRPSTGFWFILRSEDSTFFAFPFGSSGDVPAPADFDGDGKSDAAVFRAATQTWFISKSSGGTDIVGFGIAGDLPVVTDYDGDGKADIAVFRPNGANGAEWWIRRSGNLSVFATQFGLATDKAVAADYTGDGKADVAFWRPSTGQWYILRSEDFSFFAFPFGSSTDVPVPGDYDGDGKTDAAVFRPSNSTWYAQRSTAGVLIQQFGQTGDVPVPSAFVR